MNCYFNGIHIIYKNKRSFMHYNNYYAFSDVSVDY